MSIMNEYIARHLNSAQLEQELISLIGSYNKRTGTYLLVYAACISKRIPEVSLNHEDYYIIADLLRNKTAHKKLDFYLETPGGSGEAAEEIVNFIRSHFDCV